MKILLVGCGHMGSAMLTGWLTQTNLSVDVIDPYMKPVGDTRVRVYANLTAKSDADIVVLAVKPQVMDEVCADLAPHLQPGALVVSIAAGFTLTNLAKHLGADRPLIRAMPNTPGSIGQGITGFVANDKTNQKQLDMARSLLGALGAVIQVKDESEMNAVTALSGSGPAYVFALTEALEKAGQILGLRPETAAALARQTVIGAGALMAVEAAKSPENLRKAVTSPGGTTAAALDVLYRNQALEILMENALKAASERSKDLAGGQ